MFRDMKEGGAEPSRVKSINIEFHKATSLESTGSPEIPANKLKAAIAIITSFLSLNSTLTDEYPE